MSDYDSRIIRKKLNIQGAVQGVGFRYRAYYAAHLTGVTGWVRNNPDFSVSMEIQGTEAQIDQVLIMIEKGKYVQIETMVVRTIPLLDDEYSFSVIDS